MTGAELAHLGRIRVAGVLHDDARLYPAGVGGAFIALQIRPAQGLPYVARVPLGSNPSHHLQAQADVAHMRAGAMVSLAGDGLELQADHGHAALRVVHARDLVVFSDPITPPSQEG